MLNLIDARTSDRQRLSFSSKAGVSTVDVVLGVQLVNTPADIAVDNFYCCICNEDLKCGNCDPYINVSVMRLECGHVFHESCILPWFEAHRSCPSCRSTVNHFTSIPSAAELFEFFNEDQLDRKVEFAMRVNTFYGLRSNNKLGLAVKEHWGEGIIKYSESVSARRRELSNKLHDLLVISESSS
jgi:Ring finger domain